ASSCARTRGAGWSATCSRTSRWRRSSTAYVAAAELGRRLDELAGDRVQPGDQLGNRQVAKARLVGGLGEAADRLKVDDLAHRFHDGGIEVVAGARAQHDQRLLVRELRRVGRREAGPDVRNREDAARERYQITAERPRRAAGRIPVLAVEE